MGFLLGVLPITGTFDGFTFYNTKYGIVVRRAKPSNRKHFHKSPSMARARENSADFVTLAKTASKLRHQIILFTKTRNKTWYHRLIKLAKELQNLDKTSARGKRDPFKVMATKQGLSLLRSFKISADLTLYDILVTQNYLKISMGIPKKKIEKVKTRPAKRGNVTTKTLNIKQISHTQPVIKKTPFRSKAARKILAVDA